jgi:hypothetical protein
MPGVRTISEVAEHALFPDWAGKEGLRKRAGEEIKEARFVLGKLVGAEEKISP